MSSTPVTSAVQTSSSSSFSSSMKSMAGLRTIPKDLVQSDIRLRPARCDDLPQVQSIYDYYILHTVAMMEHTPPTLEYLDDLLRRVRNEKLPFIVAVSAAESERMMGNEMADDTREQEGEIVLGFMFVTPFHHHARVAARSVTTSTYVHPQVRKGGIGGRLTTLMLCLLKNPKRYTEDPKSTLPEAEGSMNRLAASSSAGASSAIPPTSTSTSSPTSFSPSPNIAFPELDPISYTAFRGIPLRAVYTVVRFAVIDNMGIGKGKERFYTKFGFYRVGVIKGCAEKFGTVFDAQIWGMELEDWDEYQGRYTGKKEPEERNKTDEVGERDGRR